MRRIAGQEQPPILHGFDDETVHFGDILLQDRAFYQLPAFLRRQADLKFAPNLVVGPERKIFIRRALDVEAADFRRTHAEQGKTTLGGGVDQFLRRWRRLSENAEPPERIISLVDGERVRGNRRAADAVKAVAADDKIAGQFGLLAFVVETNSWLCALRV